ncbi:hypothetical protein HID58_062131 [Brassica napus]|uniref:Reticulon-like protein n=1 Tax=Brassica napus TaxID=3708 RepID=A0ABQ8A0K3_BRANA|nr:hypothetical protein HID58_062131 [Brassica napus]
MVKSSPSETAMDENRGSICRKSGPSREKVKWSKMERLWSQECTGGLASGHSGQNQRPNPHSESQKNLAVSPSGPYLSRYTCSEDEEEAPSGDYSDQNEGRYTPLTSAYGLFGREKHVHKVLGRGKRIEPATDIFMWKNKKMSGGVLGGAIAAWVLLDTTLISTLLCHVVIVVLTVLFLWSNDTMFINKLSLCQGDWEGKLMVESLTKQTSCLL